MKNRLSILVPIVSLFLLTFCGSKKNNPIIQTENARFSVISDECIRIEYASSGKFIDSASYFAINRDVFCSDFKLTQNENKITIETKKIILEYMPDGKSFHENNIKGIVKMPDGSINSWYPGKTDDKNLGGTISSLDGKASTTPLGQGLLSTNGWYLHDDSKSVLFENDWIKNRPDTTAIDWYFFGYGTDYKAALNSFTRISGKISLPRKYALGSWFSRWYDFTSDEYRKLTRDYENHDFPLDIQVWDMEWHTKDASAGHGWGKKLGWTGWTWNRELLPDAEKLLQELQNDGIYVTLNVHPHDGIRDHEECYPEFMRMLGKDPAKGENITFDAGWHEYMQAYFEAAHVPLEKAGVDFWWVDWQQDKIYPHVKGFPELSHWAWLNHLYFKHTSRNNTRGQVFARWGSWGDHRYPVKFSGDAHGTWEMLAFQIPFTSTAGNIGCFYWSHDIGGFYGDDNWEKYARWVQFGAVSPALRLHSYGQIDRRPWVWGEIATISMRESFHLRSRLFPYIYTSARQSYDNSIPFIKPMYIEYPNKEEAYQNPQEFLFGNIMLVAPVTTAGIGSDKLASQKVWFPDGQWFNFFTGEKYLGESNHRVVADINEFPLFVKGGIPLPMQPYTQRMASDVLDEVVIRCFPGKEKSSGEFILYEDDGVSQGYQNDEYAQTKLEYKRMGNNISVSIHPAKGSYKGQPAKRKYIVELPNTKKATKIIVNNTPTDMVEYDSSLFLNVIKTDLKDIKETVQIDVEAEEIDANVISDREQKRRNYIFAPEFSHKNKSLVLNNGQVDVKITPANSDEKVYYTLDGLMPDTGAIAYSSAITVNEPCIITARSFKQGDEISAVSSLSIIDTSLNGVSYKYFEISESIKDIPDFATLTPVDTGKILNFFIDSVSKRGTFYAIKFTARIKISKDDEYTFYTISDDGSRLFINNRLVVDNGGRHGHREKSGKISLTKGMHEIKVHYLQASGSKNLIVSFESPNILKQKIPASLLYYNEM